MNEKKVLAPATLLYLFVSFAFEHLYVRVERAPLRMHVYMGFKKYVIFIGQILRKICVLPFSKRIST